MNIESIKKISKVLELDKILNELSRYASSVDSIEMCQNILPNFDKQSAEILVTQTSDAYMLIARFGAPSFGGIKNCNNALERAAMGGVLTMGEFLNIGSLLRVIRGVKDWKEHFSASSITSLEGLFLSLVPNKYFEDKIFASIDSEEEMNDNASIKLADIRRKIRASSSSIREKLDHIVKSSSYSKFLQDAIITQRDGRYVVPVKSEYRNEIQGLIHDTSSSGATLFIEPMAVVEVNNELRVLKNKEQEEIERILQEMSGEVAEFSDNIKASYAALIELDVIFSKAKYAFDINATVPIIRDDCKLNLKNARHPLLNKSAVPISVSLGYDFDTLIITGPNTGGKTVTLKTVGLLSLMIMCGLMIPVDSGSEINIFKNVYADIGDEQSIEQSLSTFSSHMTNIVKILNSAQKNSLVLLDELGAGTDPIEGAALAKAIIMKLRENKANVITTTHYAELKSFALDTDGVENACCEFDVATLKPTYKLLIGVPGRSNAFAISQKLGISEDIISDAQNMISDENKRFENVVTSLETARQIAESEREEAARIRAELENLKMRHQKKSEEFNKERKRIIENAKQKADDVIESARNEINSLLNELEDMKKKFTSDNAKETLQRAKEAAKNTLNRVEKNSDYVDKHKEKYKLPRKLMLGDTVILMDIDKKASVTSLPDKDGNLEVVAGIIKMRTKIENLKLIEQSYQVNGEKKKVIRNVTGLKSRAERKVESELDLRGYACDEALLEVDRFIDEALLGGIEIIRIIHGKGTGVLRKGIQSHLKTHRSVRTYRNGVFGEGENGVTIVELK